MDEEVDENGVVRKLIQRANSYQNKTESAGATDHKSYMDSDFNPLKKHRFQKDTYVTLFKELASSDMNPKLQTDETINRAETNSDEIEPDTIIHINAASGENSKNE